MRESAVIVSLAGLTVTDEVFSVVRAPYPLRLAQALTAPRGVAIAVPGVTVELPERLDVAAFGAAPADLRALRLLKPVDQLNVSLQLLPVLGALLPRHVIDVHISHLCAGIHTELASYPAPNRLAQRQAQVKCQTEHRPHHTHKA